MDSYERIRAERDRLKDCLSKVSTQLDLAAKTIHHVGMANPNRVTRKVTLDVSATIERLAKTSRSW